MKFYSIKERFANFLKEDYSLNEWKCMKISFSYVFSVHLVWMLNNFNAIPYPVGILRFIDVNWLFLPICKTSVLIFTFSLLFCYIIEYKMIATLLMLFIISVFVFSIGESNGILGRNGLMSLVFLAQLIAYCFSYFGCSENIFKNRVQFSVQPIAALYTLAALSKITDSGIFWFQNAPNLSVQILKSFENEFVTNGNYLYQIKGDKLANWILYYPNISRFLLAITLLLEIFSFTLILNKRWRFFYGFLLLFMHIGILFFMNILFESISYPMIIYCINPLFLVYSITILIYKELNSRFIR